MGIMPIIFIVIAVGWIFFLIYGTILAFTTTVPLVVTPEKRFKLIFDYIESVAPKPIEQMKFIDLGSGVGSILFRAEYKGFGEVVGYEISRLYAGLTKVVAFIKNSKVQVCRKNFYQADISDADVIYMFLTRKAFEKLSSKIITQAKPGAIVIILCDQLQGKEPVKVIQADKKKNINIYCYQI